MTMEPADLKTANKDSVDDYKYNPMLKKSPLDAEIVDLEKRKEKKGNRTLWMSCFVLLLGVCAVSFSGTMVVWGTNIIEDSIIETLVIENNTKSYDWWVKPPIDPFFIIRVFNYTNVDRFMAGVDAKLKVAEVGPYVYREIFDRVNVAFHPNGTVSYQERRDFIFLPELSVGNINDNLTVPNMAFLGSASIMKDAYYIMRLSMSALYRSLDIKPFMTINAKDLFWGYDDPLFTMGKSFMALQGKKDDPQNMKLGLLIARNGTGSSRILINTGVNDIKRLGIIEKFGGKNKMKIWGTEECNRIDGTDGSFWPPILMSKDARLYMFMKDMCRKYPMVFKEMVTVHGNVEAMRFQPPRDIYATGETQPENACFCHKHSSTCPPAGVFNASPCSFNAPVMMSFPHFYLGDPILLNTVDGLKPDPKKHDMYLDLHPKFGFPMGGISRFQVNIMVRKSLGISHLDYFQDESILPIAWFEVVVRDIPPEVRSVLDELTFATITLKRIFLFMFLISFLVIVLITSRYYYTRYCEQKHKVVGSNIYRQSTLVALTQKSEC